MNLNRFFLASVKLSFLHIFGYGSERDRLIKDMFFTEHNKLIFSLIVFLSFFLGVCAQKSNEECYDEMIIQFHQKRGVQISGLTGSLTSGIRSAIPLEPGAKFLMEILDPKVEYEPIKGKQYNRVISVKLVYTDEENLSFFLSRSDTISKGDLIEVRKNSSDFLKGDNPGFKGKVLIPSLMIAGGVSAIVSLFYIRS